MKTQKTAENPANTDNSQTLITIPPAPIPVDTICLGQNVSLKAVEAIRRGRSAGEPQFPGITNAKLEISNGMAHQEDEYFDGRRELPIEIGGARLSRDPLRRMTAFLGIEEDGPLSRISKDVEEADQGGDFGQFTVRDLTDAMLKIGFTVKATVNCAIDLLHYVHHKLIHRPKDTETTALKNFFEEFKAEYVNERARKSLEALINQSVRRRRKSVVELAAAFESFAYAETDKAKVRETAHMILKALYEYEVAFWDGIEVCKKTPKFQIHCKPKGGQAKTLTGVILTGIDNPRIVPASREAEAGGCDVTIVRNTLGNVGIFWKKGIGSPFQLWRMIQAQEMLYQGTRGEDINWTELTEEGHPDIQNQWRLVLKNGLIANGINQNDIQETGINNTLLQEAVQHAYSGEGITKWRRNRHIAAPERRDDVANQPAPGANPAVDSQPKADAQAPVNGTPKAKKATGRKSKRTEVPPSPIPADQKGTAGDDLATALDKALAEKAEKEKKAPAKKKRSKKTPPADK